MGRYLLQPRPRTDRFWAALACATLPVESQTPTQTLNSQQQLERIAKFDFPLQTQRDDSPLLRAHGGNRDGSGCRGQEPITSTGATDSLYLRNAGIPAYGHTSTSVPIGGTSG